ncbi:11565_t:CDS:2 [Funneliformis geosporum]|uniref:11565_t:CDS:1 n=1 Tax=Funneliformis geosporum TaxID=1117311 RepID=A0A9W4T246_9GLOM|nr:11565_t:CDS:2 [Funneliformis geosporum]
MAYYNNNNDDGYYPQNTGYYGPNDNINGKFLDQRGNANVDNFYNNNDHQPQHINNPSTNYINNNNYDDGGGVYHDPRNGFSNNDPYYPTNKSPVPGDGAYGDSGYSIPYNMPLRSNSQNQNYVNPYPVSSNEPKPFQNSYNSPTHYPSSTINYPTFPTVNVPHSPINSIPAHQVPYRGHPTDSGSTPKEMLPSNYSSMPSSNPGPKPPSNYGYEKPFGQSSERSSKHILPEEEKNAKPGAAVLLWARPPKVEFLGIVPSPKGLPPYEAKASGFDFNFGLKISVDNPNIVGANFKMIQATAFYPGHSEPIGGGNLTNVKISSKGNTIIEFPFSVNYDKDIDPGFVILFDIARKCGLTGGEKEKLEIDYKLTLTIKVLLITINPSFDKKAMIDCPIKDGQIPNIPGFDIGKAAKEFNGKKK